MTAWTTDGEYGICRICVKRIKVTEGDALEQARCECGALLRPYEPPMELEGPAHGVMPKLTRFWIAGREDGYWEERRFIRPAAAARAGVTPRSMRFAYESGRRAGERLRLEAWTRYRRVLRMTAGNSQRAASA